MSQLYQFNKHRNHPHTKAEKGQGVVEYALLLALVALAVIAIINILEPAVANVFSQFVQEAPVAPPSLLSYTPPPTETPPPSATATLDPSITPSVTPTASHTPTPSQTPTPSDTPTPTNTPTVTPTPTPAPNILFVVGNTTLSAADQSILTQLESLNLLLGNVNNPVLIKSDSAVLATDAAGMDLVFVSASVATNQVTNKFQTVEVPVMVMEDGILDDMGMVGGSGGNYHGNDNNETDLTIVASGHVLAATLSNQDYTVYNSSNELVYGLAEAGATKIATTVNDPDRAVIFAFAEGAGMPASPWTAPARRVSFFLYENIEIDTGLTTQGLELFNAAVCWAMTNAACP